MMFDTPVGTEAMPSAPPCQAQIERTSRLGFRRIAAVGSRLRRIDIETLEKAAVEFTNGKRPGVPLRRGERAPTEADAPRAVCPISSLVVRWYLRT